MPHEVRAVARAAGLLLITHSLAGCFFFTNLIEPPNTTDTASPDDSGSDTSPPDTAPPEARCFQQEAVDAGQVEFLDTDVVIDPITLAAYSNAPLPTAPPPGALQDEPYYGAIDPTEPTPWWSGWTYIDSRVAGGLPGPPSHPLQDDIAAGDLAPAAESRCGEQGFGDGGEVLVFGVRFPVCVVSDAILTDTTFTSDHVYVLTTDVRVGDGDQPLDVNPEPLRVTLEIQAGTQVFGSIDQFAALVVTRGSRLRARGTAARPVIFSAVETFTGLADIVIGDPTDLTGRGQWLGLTLAGFGRVNQTDEEGETFLEQALFGRRWFGGTIDADRSGDLDYVVIAEAGVANWRSGLRLEGAGRGTTLDHVQVLGSEGHCVESYGGAAFVRHLVCSGADQQGLSQNRGYNGDVQWALVVMDPFRGVGGVAADSSPDLSSVPVTAPRMANISVLGHFGAPAFATIAARHRRGARGQVHRAVYAELAPGGLSEGCLDIDDSLPAGLTYTESIFSCARGPLAPCDD